MITNKIRNFFSNSPAVRSTGELLLGNLIAQIILVVSAPILTRLYAPEEYGVLGTYSALVMVLSVIATLRYELAILLPQQDEEAEQLTIMASALTVTMSLIIGVILWGIAVGVDPPWLRPLRPYIGLLTLSILFYGLAQIFTHRMMRRQQFRLQMHSSWVQALTYVMIQLGGGMLRAGTVGLLVGQLAGQVASAVMLGRTLSYRRTGRRQLHELVHQYRHLPLYNMPTTLIYTLQTQLPILLAASLYTAKEAGWLVLGLRIVGRPVEMLSTSLGRVYISRAAELVRQSPETLQTLVLRTLKQLFLMAIAPTLLSAAAAPALFAWIFGSDWRPSGEYLQILSPMLLMNLLVFPLYHTLTVLNKSNLLLGIETLRIVLVFLSFWLPAVLGHSVRVALWAYSASYILTQLLLMGMIVKASHSLLSRQVKYGGDEDRQDEDVNKDR
jgi:O-antigen/teichoic acid export membrane protein